MSLTHQTRQLLSSLMSRSDARLKSAAVKTRSERPQLEEVEAVDLPEHPRSFELTSREVVESLAAEADVLARDAWELMWSEVTEELVEQHEMECDGLGSFSFDSDRGVVHFKADQALAELAPMQVTGEDSMWSVAMVAVAEGMSLAQKALLTATPAGDTVEEASRFLRSAGQFAVEQAARRSTPDAAPIAARASAALASFQAVIWALGKQLRDTERVDVPLIGTFTSSLDVISFEASPDLIDMLVANDRIAW